MPAALVRGELLEKKVQKGLSLTSVTCRQSLCDSVFDSDTRHCCSIPVNTDPMYTLHIVFEWIRVLLNILKCVKIVMHPLTLQN